MAERIPRYKIHKAYPKVHENLKLITDEHVIEDNPESHSGSMSSMKNLEDTDNFGDQFLYDKPTEDDQKKTKITPFIALQLRVAKLEQDMSEVKKTDHSAAVLASIKSQVPTVEALIAIEEAMDKNISSDDVSKQYEGHVSDLEDTDNLIIQEWTIPPNDFPEPENNWANAYATTYQVPAENKLQRKTYDIGSFIKWFCRRTKKKKLCKADLEGPAFNLLGIESYQTQLNLERPNWDATDYFFKEDYTIVPKPRAVIYIDRNDQRKLMRLNEIHKFSDGTLTRVMEKLDHMVKDFHLFEYNRRSKDFITAIEKRLQIRRIFRSLESFDTYPILLSFTHCGNKSILRVLRIILVILPEHPSETKVFHNEDGNPARANIKQALGSYERPHKGVKASTNSDIVYFFTSAQDGDPLQDDDLQHIDADDLEEMDLKWQMAMLTNERPEESLNKTGSKLVTKCRAPRENKNREPVRRNVTVETTETKALVAQDGLGYDWCDQAKEGPTNFILMAYTSSGSSSSSSLDYERPETREYKKNEVVFEEDIKILKLDIMLRDNALTELRKKFEKAEKERDDLKLTLEKFEKSSKNLSKLLEI
ncbi:hypothetical protein Tco_0550435 [Tanacetum coccineum]